MRLFCFPYGGGSSNTFDEWEMYLPHVVEVAKVELPGRRLRFGEPPFKRMEPLLDALHKPMLELAEVPILLFGHSMGALIAFEMARRLQQTGEHYTPIALFVSAQKSPQLRQEEDAISKLPQAEFLARLNELNGMPPEVLANSELLELLLPTIRADFELTENYRYARGPKLLCPVTAFCGALDRGAPASVMQKWKNMTTEDFRLLELEGDHFFVNSMRRRLLQLLKNEILRIHELRAT